jgi:hypothetical protein
MPVAHLITEPPPSTESHPIALLPPAEAERLRPLFISGYNATTLSGFEDETLGWYIAYQPDTQRVLVIVLENSTAAQAAALAAQLPR